MARVKNEDAGAAELAKRIEVIDLSDDDKPQVFDLVGIDDDEDEIDSLPLGPAPSAFRRESTALPPNSTTRDSVQVHGQTITCGMTVELQDGDFLRIVNINAAASHKDLYLQGNLLRRTKYVKGMLDKKLNEVCLIMQTTFCEGVGDAKLEQCLTTRRPHHVVQVRECVYTNQPFPAHSWRETLQMHDLLWEDVKDSITEQAQLVCRWRHTQEVGLNVKGIEESMMQLRESECDAKYRCSDVLRMRGYGSDNKDQDRKDAKAPMANTLAIPAIDLTETLSRKRSHAEMCPEPEDSLDVTVISSDEDSDVEIIEPTVRRRAQNGQSSLDATFATKKAVSNRPIPQTRSNISARYRLTFGDLCTGAGGMASGAQQAGLKVNFLLDHWKDACDTLTLNFKDCKILQEDIYSFCTRTLVRRYTRVDVLHISFPCQPHSPAHTKPGQNDEANIATGYSVGPILEKSRPRIVTFEQTSGMLTHNDKVHFHALIRQITDKGYSVRWRICNLAEYGNSQPRRRLIILAACPGEVLPRFPNTTHGAEFGKKSFATIAQALQKANSVPTPENMTYSYQHDKASYNANQPLRSAITCSGGSGNNHPSGKRTFTNHELAQLQSFPLSHKFSGVAGSIKKQIGNAVPSVFAKTLFSHIAKSMEQSNQRVAAYKPEIVEIE